MNEKTEYLNEEWYQENAKKLKQIGKIVLIIGLVTLVVSFIMIFLVFLGFGRTVTSGIASNEIGNVDNAQMAKGAFGGIGLVALGGFINFAGLVISAIGGIIMVIAHNREIKAFTTQQIMPVAQEGIEKMAPTIGNAAGTIAQSIALGIKEGMKESDNSQASIDNEKQE